MCIRDSLNTIRKTFNEIFQVEQGAKYTQEDKGDYYEVKITIPKNRSKNSMGKQQIVNQ